MYIVFVIFDGVKFLFLYMMSNDVLINWYDRVLSGLFNNCFKSVG